jgi:putative drug exporter of the RND superfamily
MAALKQLRNVLIPETVGALPNTDVGVTGIAARWKDELDQMKSKLPYVIAFVLVFAFALTRSRTGSSRRPEWSRARRS